MTLLAPGCTEPAVKPLSLANAPSLIERVLPAQKLSAEAQKERKAGAGQTLTALGSYWKGRKPLILARACVLGALLPATEDSERDLAVFEKLMAIDDAALDRRFYASSKRLTAAVAWHWLHDPKFESSFDLRNPSKVDWRDPTTISPREALDLVHPRWLGDTIDLSGDAPTWSDTASERDVVRIQLNAVSELRRRAEIAAFRQMPYTEKLPYCLRPEEVDEDGLYGGIWEEVNEHLGTTAGSFPELAEQLGIKRFGHRPRVGDSFCGAGSIPFEAARVGCDVYASDLNPIGCLLTWGALNIVGGDAETRRSIERAQREIADAVDREIVELGIEHDEEGNRAKAYLWCLEVQSTLTNGWRVPIASSWVISWSRGVCAHPRPNHETKSFDIDIVCGASVEEMEAAAAGSAQDGDLVWSIEDETHRVSIPTLRGDYRQAGGLTGNRLRPWEKHDIVPQPEDLFQERLYCVQWIEAETLGTSRPKFFFFRAPTEADLERGRKVEMLVRENLTVWQAQGLVPDMLIEPGDNTSQPIWERGWTYWHHLFPPRHLLIAVLIAKKIAEIDDLSARAGATLSFCQVLDRMSRLTRWRSLRRTPGRTGGLSENIENVFYNQALNTLVNGASRSFVTLGDFLKPGLMGHPLYAREEVECTSAEQVDILRDIWITDPPYADAINYHEITEYFIAWLRRSPPRDDWTWDSRRALAIKGSDESFRKAMVDGYRAIAEHMPDNGLQIVMFTHQDAGVWGDMAAIMWGAGLQVTGAWYITTETTSEIKKGGYVQGTVLLILRKRQGDGAGYKDEIVEDVRDEVARQIEEMVGLNQRLEGHGRIENLFEDVDLQMAGYAAALKVLTGYSRIDGIDMTEEAIRPRERGQHGLVGEIIDFAVQVANERLVPEGLSPALWERLKGTERFYLKMLDVEAAGAKKVDNYQNFAKAFRVADYRALMASTQPNAARLKTARDFKRSEFGGSEFGQSPLRALLYALYEVEREVDVDDARAHLRDMIADYYRRRDDLVEMGGYIARKRNSSVPQEAEAARVLAARIRSERLGE